MAAVDSQNIPFQHADLSLQQKEESRRQDEVFSTRTENNKSPTSNVVEEKTEMDKFFNGKNKAKYIERIQDIDMSKAFMNSEKSELSERFGLNFIVLMLALLFAGRSQSDEVVLNDYFKIMEWRISDPGSFDEIVELCEKKRRSVDNVLKSRAEELLKCVICRQRDVEILNLPCGHLALCKTCSCGAGSNRTCISCNSEVMEIVQIFL